MWFSARWAAYLGCICHNMLANNVNRKNFLVYASRTVSAYMYVLPSVRVARVFTPIHLSGLEHLEIRMPQNINESDVWEVPLR